MVCEWCGVASASGNHATIHECVEALEREVAMLKQAITQRERFLERMRQSTIRRSGGGGSSGTADR